MTINIVFTDADLQEGWEFPPNFEDLLIEYGSQLLMEHN